MEFKFLVKKLQGLLCNLFAKKLKSTIFLKIKNSILHQHVE